MCHHSLTTSGPRAMDSNIPAKGRASGQGRFALSSGCAALAGTANAMKRSAAAALFFMNAIYVLYAPRYGGDARSKLYDGSRWASRFRFAESSLPALRARRADPLFKRSWALNLTRARAFHTGDPSMVAGAAKTSARQRFRNAIGRGWTWANGKQ